MPAKAYTGNLYELDLVFSYEGKDEGKDEGTVWVRHNGSSGKDSINLTGQHGTLSDNSNLCVENCKDYIGYIVCSTKGYADFINYYHKDNIKYATDVVEAIPYVELSSKEKQKSVIGVIADKRQNFNLLPLDSKLADESKRVIVNSIGEGCICVSDINGNIENGDYIITSIIPGIGMKQDDDILHNYTVAKATMDCDFNPNYIPIIKGGIFKYYNSTI